MKLPRIEPQIPSKDKFNGLIVIGEAPGETEIKVGQPFVGKSGKLLTEMMTNADIDRQQCLITNVFLCRPPNNKVAYFFNTPSFKTTADIKTKYKPELRRMFDEIDPYRPRVIIALGRIASMALFSNTKPMTEIVGTLRQTGSGFILPLYHPSYLLRPFGRKQIKSTTIALKLARQIAKRLV